MSGEPPSTDWYLREWLAHFGKRQASLVNELGWTNNRAHLVWHSVQHYRRSEVDEISRWLGIRPFELLMHPRDALALRRIRETAALIVAEPGSDFDHRSAHDPPEPLRRVGK